MRRKYSFLILAMLFPVKFFANILFIVDPITANAAPGSTDNVFEVLLTTDSSSWNVDSFIFEVTTTDTDVSFTSADSMNLTDPYIFAGNSFQGSGPLNSDSGQTLDAGDVTASFTDVTLAPNTTYALGEVIYSISDTAALGPFTISFGNSSSNNLSDAEGNTYFPTLGAGQQVNIEAIPEPCEFGPLGTLLAFCVLSGLRHRLCSNYSKQVGALTVRFK